MRLDPCVPRALTPCVFRLAISLAAVAGMGIPPGPGFAAPPDFTEGDIDSLIQATIAGIPGTSLSLEEALGLGFENATSVRDAESALVAARGELRRERGDFDPEIFVAAERSGEDAPTASAFSGADVLETEETSAGAGARIRLRTGTEIEASVNTTKFTTNSTFATLDPQYDTFGALTVRQPLLSGFGPSARAGLTAAERRFQAAEARYRDALLALESDLEAAYWEIHAAERDFAVQRLVRDRAAAFLDEVRTRARAGLVGPNEVASARVFLAEQELALIDREEALDGTSDRMVSLIGVRPAGTSLRFRVKDTPPEGFPVPPVDELVAAAVEHNQEVRATRAEAASVEALARAARWDALPELDVFGSLGGRGLSGTGRDVVFGSDTLRTDIDGGFGDSFGQVTGRDFPTWSVGVSLVVPLGFREGRGERDRLRGEAGRAEERVRAAVRLLEEAVREAHRKLVHGSQRLQASREGMEAAQEQVRIGFIEYRNGRSTAFELVRLGADLAASQKRYSESLVRTARAAAELKRLTAGVYDASARNRNGS